MFCSWLSYQCSSEWPCGVVVGGWSVFRKTLSFCCRRAASKVMSSTLLCWPITIRGRCWWYGSRGWTFPPIPHYMLLLCNQWQQRGSLTEWCLTRKCIWSTGVAWISSMQKKYHPLTFINSYWIVNGDQTVDVRTSEGVGGAFQHWWQWCERRATLWMAAQIFMSAALVHCYPKCIANGGDCVGK